MGSEGSSQHSRNLAVLFSFAIILLMLLIACGGGGNSTTTSHSVAVFSSTPPTAASEGTAYAYQLAVTDSGGGSIALALTSAPTGATLNGNTVSWTPTAAQSRVSNSFTVTATTSSGASATQSWTVTPAGTVRISWVDTHWTENGSTPVPFNWTPVSSFVAALVPQPDGSFQTLAGSAVNGVFNIPNVPAGFYWLRISPTYTYWTSSSNFDMGTDYAVPMIAPAPSTPTTTVNFSLTSLDTTAGTGWMQVVIPDGPPLLPIEGTTAPGSSTWTGSAIINGNIDLSEIKTAFAMQYEPAALGTVNGFVLGPELSLADLSLTSGTANTISGSLNPSVPASMNLSINASDWKPLFDRIAPTPITATGGVFAASVQPYPTSQIVTRASAINLIWSPLSGLGPAFSPNGCSGSFSSFSNGSPILAPPLTSDIDAGTVQYSDPFPTAWLRSFTLIQCATVDISLPGGSSIQTFILNNTQSTALPTAPVVPLISPVQNPMINGADLFTASTISGAAVTLSWSEPAIGAPYGYQVQILTPTNLPSGSSAYSSLATLSTAKTTLTVPPNLIGANGTFLFVITALIDGEANMETSPHHSALPVASANVISAPITISRRSSIRLGSATHHSACKRSEIDCVARSQREPRDDPAAPV